MPESIKKIARRVIFYLKVLAKDFKDLGKVRLLFKIYPYTMVGYYGLSNIYDLCRKAEKDKLKGVFAECGVWKGGSVAIMAFVAEKAGSGRKTWLFDSFEGLPEPTAQDGPRAKDYAAGKMSGKLATIEKCVGPLGDVKKIFFDILKINPGRVIIRKGWFQATLPKAKNEMVKISVLRLDGDWYESTKCCLDNLYDVVIPGGYVIIDDYGCWEGARQAVDEFFEKRGIKVDIIKIDSNAVYFKKPL